MGSDHFAQDGMKLQDYFGVRKWLLSLQTHICDHSLLRAILFKSFTRDIPGYTRGCGGGVFGVGGGVLGALTEAHTKGPLKDV